MRVLNKNEVSEVSGGFLCLVGGLLSCLFGSRSAPKSNNCAPAPKSNYCAPAPKKRRGC
jgi:hypothetical protein